MAAIGVGLMGRPKLLMLDEPTLGLAPRIRAELAEQIGRIVASGTDLLIVDQDVDLLLGLCPRLYLIEKGAVSMQINDRSELQHQDVLQRYFGSTACWARSSSQGWSRGRSTRSSRAACRSSGARSACSTSPTARS